MISSNPEIMGGDWCITGTRIPAAAIGKWMLHSINNAKQIQREYPTLTIEQIEIAAQWTKSVMWLRENDLESFLEITPRPRV
jgi:uncharacterized protein (DUF433 family)